MRTSLGVLLLAVPVVLQTSSGEPTQPPDWLPDCDLQVVTYSPSRYQSRITFQSVAGSQEQTAKSPAVKSPQETRWYLLQEPDMMKAGPWNTTLIVRGNPKQKNFIRLHFADHGTGRVQPRWVNEKLLFIEVWWGRLVATDLIVDIEKGEIVYIEDAGFHATVAPCRGMDGRAAKVETRH